MKFELTYSDASITVVEISDKDLREWLRVKARTVASQNTDKDQDAKGPVTAVRVI